MAIKLNKDESVFRNELLFTADAKAINIDYTMVNLFMLLHHDGIRPKQRTRAGENAFIEIEKLKKAFGVLEEEGSISGFTDHPDAIEIWLRTNLVNMVFRGNLDKEKISSLRPIHLESYRLRNAQNTRDYFSADQVYLMLGQNPQVKEDLKLFLMEGWDKTTDSISNAKTLDVDSLGVLHLIKKFRPGFIESSSTLNQIKPILKEQAELYCDDVRRLLVYKREIPRNVLIDYLKTITSFHLSLYIQKLIYLLPKIITEGRFDIKDDWSIVLDSTDDFESKISKVAIEDADRMYNSIYDYIKATFQINAVLKKENLEKNNSKHLDRALEVLKNPPDDFDVYFKMRWNFILGSLDDEDKELLNSMVKYETSYFDKYIELLVKTRGPYQYKYHVQFIDNLSQKNNERGFIAQGRSKKHPRRFVLGTRLLEALVQIQVLHREDDCFITKSLSIEELTEKIKERYGLIINGLSESRFEDSDLNTHLAFKENVEAFKQKLRQIGFYNDLSDAYILQKIRPRYELK